MIGKVLNILGSPTIITKFSDSCEEISNRKNLLDYLRTIFEGDLGTFYLNSYDKTKMNDFLDLHKFLLEKKIFEGSDA